MRAPALRLAVLAAVLSVSPASAQTTAAEVTDAAGASLLRLNTDAGLVVRGTADTGVIPATGEGVRMMWFPGRYAFRAGRVAITDEGGDGTTFWNLANIGVGSAAFGENTRASGSRSFAAGLTTTASGAEAIALGNGSTASGGSSFAFNGTASATGAVAIGRGAQATGDDALALGPSSLAYGLASVVIGPSIARGSFAVAIGLQNSASGHFSVAIGKNARTAGRQGSIVISDGCAGFSSDSTFATVNNEIAMRGCGGYRFYTSQNIRTGTGVFLAAGGTSWQSISDSTRKERHRAVDGEALLARFAAFRAPTTWRYRGQTDAERHYGPMAQDFFAAFGRDGVGTVGTDTTLATQDVEGVLFAAAQALEARTREQEARLAALADENAALRAEVAETRALRSEVAALRAERDAERAASETRLARIEAALAVPAVSTPVITASAE